MDQHFYIIECIHRKLTGEISTEEERMLSEWLAEKPENEEIFRKISDEQELAKKLKQYDSFNRDKVWSNIDAQLFTDNKVRSLRQNVLKYAAAILIPILAAGTYWIYYNLSETDTGNLAENNEITIQAGTQKASLVLADGSVVDLSAENISSDIAENGAIINLKPQSLEYTEISDSGSIRPLAYNTLNTPKGGEYRVRLADGTEVWLNAGSSLKFPVAFTDSTRQVFLEGEAYFDVSHTGKPFIVTSQEMDIRVLGTEFNVTAYSDDENILTTLVEGKVRIEGSSTSPKQIQSVVLNPNQQAVLQTSNNSVSVKQVDTDVYTAWMKGKFSFQNETLENVMKKLARWYNFEYNFTNTESKQYHYTGRIGRHENIEDLLEMLELTTNVKFNINKNTITVQ